MKTKNKIAKLGLVIMILLMSFVILTTQEVKALTLNDVNLVQNSEFYYTADDESIMNWRIGSDNNPSDTTIAADRTIHNVVEASSDTRALRTNASNLHNQFRVSTSNLDAEMRIRARSVNGAVADRAYVSLAQTIEVRANTEYTIEVDFTPIAENSSQVHTLRLFALPGTIINPTTADPALAATPVITPEIDRQKIVLSFNSGNHTTITIAFRVIARNDSTSVFTTLHSIEMFNKADYDTMNGIRDLFMEDEMESIIFSNKSDFDAIYNPLKGLIEDEDNGMNHTIRAQIQEKLMLAKNQRDQINDLDFRLDDLYTDDTETELIENIDDETMLTLETDITAIEREDFRNELLERFQKASDMKYLRDTRNSVTSSLNSTANNLKQMIESMENLTSAEKLAYQNQIDVALNQELDQIEDLDNTDLILELGDEGVLRLEDTFLLASQADAKNSLDAYAQARIGYIQNLTYLTQSEIDTAVNEIEMMLTNAKTAISQSDSVEDVYSLRDAARLEMLATTLYASKEAAKAEIEYQASTIAANGISVELRAIIDDKKDDIDRQTTISSVDFEKDEAISDITLQVNKEDNIAMLPNHAQEVSDRLDTYAGLTANQLIEIKNSLEDLLNAGIDNINDSETLSQVTQARLDAEALMNTLDLTSRKTDANQTLTAEKNEIEALIIDMSYLTEGQKMFFIDDLVDILSEVNSNIDQKMDLNSITIEQNSGTLHLETVLLNAYKQNGLNELDVALTEVFNTLDDLENISEEEKDEVKVTITSIVNNAIENISNANNKTVIDSIINSAKNEIELEVGRITILDETNLEEARQRYTSDLSDFATNLKNEVSALGFLDSDQINGYHEEIDELLNLGNNLLADEENTESIEQVKQIYENYANSMSSKRDDAQLQNIKNEAKNVTSNKYEELAYEINLLDSLESDEIDYYQGLLLNALTAGNNSIQTAADADAVGDARNNANSSLESVYLQAYRQNAKNVLLTDAESIKTQIDTYTHVSETRRNQLKEQIDQRVESTNDLIDLSNEFSEVDQNAQDAKSFFRSLLDAAISEQNTYIETEKWRLKTELMEAASEAISLIDGLAYLTEEEKDNYIIQIEAIRDEGLDEIDASNSLEQALGIFDQKLEEIDELALEHKKEDAKREIEESVLTLLDGGSLNEALTEKINDILTNITASTTIIEVDEAKNQGLIELTDLFEEELTEIRDQVKEALETHAKSPTDAFIDELIQSYVERVTIQNYNSPELIAELIEAGKEEIDEYYLGLRDEEQQRVSDILAAFVVTPVLEEYQEIIDLHLEMITVNNYDDQEAIDQIIESAKTDLTQKARENAKNEIDAYIEVHFGTDVSNNLQDLIDALKTSIDYQESVSDVNDKLEDSKLEIDAYKNQAYQDTKTNLREVLEAHAGHYALDVEDIIVQAENQVNLDNYQDEQFIASLTASAKADMDMRILSIQKNVAKVELLAKANETYVGMLLSPTTEDLLEEANILIEYAVNKIEIDEIYNEYAEKITEQFQKEILLRAFEENYQSYISSGLYAQNGLEALEAIYEEALNNIENTDIATFEYFLLEAIYAFDAVRIYEVKNGDFAIYQLDLHYQNEDGTLFAGIRNQLGIDRGTNVQVAKIDPNSDDEKAIMDFIRSGALTMPTNTMYTKEQMIDMLVNHQLFRQLDINLLDKDGNVITDFEGVYEVSFLLPEQLEKTLDIRIVYLTEDGVKLFETHRMDNWITFKTEHFSMFYVLGYETQTVTTEIIQNNLDWILILLLIIIVFEVIAILVKRRNNELRLRSVTFPVLFLGISSGLGMTLIWLLVILIVFLAIYLIYLFIVTPPLSNKKAVTINDQVDHHLTPRIEYTENHYYHGELKEEPTTDLENEVETLDKGLYIRYNYSFIARLHQAPLESQERFSELKNYILSYEDVRVSASWRYERFIYQGKPIVKIWIHGNAMKLYFNLDPTQFHDTKYTIENVSYAKMHETTPTLLNVNGPRLLEYAKELVDLYMKGVENQRKEITAINYTLPYENKKTLIKRKLIKVKEVKG